jgi:acetyl-CoA synthetase
MSEVHVFPVPESFRRDTLMTREQYDIWYRESIEQPEAFWAARATEFISFSRPWNAVVSADFNKVDVRWFEGAELNVSYNCLDRHLATRGDQDRDHLGR